MKGFFSFVTRLCAISVISKFSPEVEASVTTPLDPHQVVIFMYGPSGDKDLELVNLSINLPFARDDFMLAGANFKSSYYGVMSGKSQGHENIAYDFSGNTIYDAFKTAHYHTAAIGYWPFAVGPNVDIFSKSDDPVTILQAAANFIDTNKNNNYFLTVQFPRVDINFIEGVDLDRSIKCIRSIPPWQTTCIDQTYGTSIRWGVANINRLIGKLGNNATVVWFAAAPADDPSVHEFSNPRRSNRALRDSLFGLEMDLRTNIKIKQNGILSAIDLMPTLCNIAGIKCANGDGIDWLDPQAKRKKELWWFTPVATKGKCIFNSPAYARITNFDGGDVFQTWDAKSNVIYATTDRFKAQPLRLSIPKPLQTNIAIPGCENYPDKPIQNVPIKASKPKIISVLVLDDMNLLNQLIYLAPELKPVLDKGVIFSNFHGWVICSPSRSQILTSHSALNKQIGIFGVYPDFLPAQTPVGMPKYLGARGKLNYLPEFFSKNGRVSILSGKEHVSGGKVDPSFYGFTPGFIKCYDCISGQMYNQFVDSFPEQSASLIFEHSIASTNKALARGKNVFAYLGFKTMHIKIHVSPTGLVAANSTQPISDIIGTPRFNLATPLRTQQALAKIFAKAFKEYIQYLEQVDPNAVVVLTADNGPETRINGGAENGADGSSALTGPHIDVKRGLGEGAHSTDAVFFGLGKRGVVSDLTSNMDIFPTLIALSGDTDWTPAGINQFEGVNLAPLIFNNDKSKLQNRTLIMERRGPEHTDFIKVAGRYIILHSDIEGEWRLVLGSLEKKAPRLITHFPLTKLFNLRTDPNEFNDVSDQRPDKVHDLTQFLKEYTPYSDNSFASGIPADAITDKCRAYRIGSPC